MDTLALLSMVQWSTALFETRGLSVFTESMGAPEASLAKEGLEVLTAVNGVSGYQNDFGMYFAPPPMT
jgi:hypothetical protein